MLGENIKALRKARGFTQEDLANRLNVVRQTVSKWEKNLSVPDAEMLQKLAEILEVDVATLLGAKVRDERDENELATQLARINEQLSVRNRRQQRVWRTLKTILWVILLITLILIVLNVGAF